MTNWVINHIILCLCRGHHPHHFHIPERGQMTMPEAQEVVVPLVHSANKRPRVWTHQILVSVASIFHFENSRGKMTGIASNVGIPMSVLLF